MGGTLKTTGLSLLAGAILLLVGVLLMDIGSWLSSARVESIGLDERTARVDNKTATLTNDSLQLVIPDIRVFVVGLKFEQPINTQDYHQDLKLIGSAPIDDGVLTFQRHD